MALIQIDRLNRDYGQGRDIFDLSFSAEEGETFGLLGPSGAGKSTAIRRSSFWMSRAAVWTP